MCTAVVTLVDSGHEYDSTREAEVDDAWPFDWLAPRSSRGRTALIKRAHMYARVSHVCLVARARLHVRPYLSSYFK